LFSKSKIKWLNMDPKPDKECDKRGDIVLLSKIMANSINWHDYALITPSNYSERLKGISHRGVILAV